MANRERLYFYAPTWDSPPDGPIRLGNVITSVTKPDRPLACNPPPSDSDVFRTEKRSVRYTREKLRSGRFSVLTKFLSFLGFGVDVGVDFHRSDEETFTFQTVETAQFVPTPSYLQQTCVESDDVLRYLELSKYRKPVYIITGVKVVTGAEANTLKARNIGGSQALEVDGTIWSGGGVPVAMGPGLEGRAGRKAVTKWEGASDFVFAFRVTKVLVDKATVRVRSETDYREGAMLGDEAEDPPSGPGLSVLESQDLDGESQGFDVQELKEDADAVLCAVPKRDERYV